MSKVLGIAFALFFLVFGLPTGAQVLPVASLHWKETKYDVMVKFNDDLTSEREISQEFQALSDQGAKAIGMTSKSYNRDLQTLTLVEAYTLKPDGRKISVPPESVQTQNGVASGANGISWPNVSIIQVTYSDVRNGDRTFVKWHLSEKKLVLEHWATDAQYLNPLITLENFTYRVEAPEAANLQLVAVGLQTTTEVKNGIKTWQVRGNQIATSIDNQTVNWSTSVPRVLVSSFKTQEQLAQAYGAASNPKAIPIADVKALGLEITKGLTDPREQARAIYKWMQKNVRYVASFIGGGGWVPHDLSTILQLRYGDCKDYQLLFQALLASVNIEAAPALINAGVAQFEYLDLPVGFDHVITYLPQLGIFADATAKGIPFEELPWADADRPVAVALPDGAKLMRTPIMTASQNEVSSKSNWKIKSNGDADLDLRISTKGYAATETRSQLSQIPSGMTGFAIQNILKQSGLQGKGFAQYSPLQQEQLTQTLDAQIEIQRLIADLGDGSVPVNPRLAIAIYVENNLQNYSTGSRKFHALCTPLSVYESFETQLDSSYKITRIPADIELNNADGIQFTAHYEQTNNTVSGWRKLTMSQGRHSCSPHEFNNRKQTLDDIEQHLRSKILFSK